MRILSIDPSASRTAGWGLVDLSTDPEEWNFGAWELSGINFQARCRDLVDHIDEDIGHFDQLVLEWPMYYDCDRGEVAAREGHTINLSGIAMFIAGWYRMEAKDTFLYTAPDWKGTVSKKVTARRFLKAFGEQYHATDPNAIDACMMLVFHCRLKELV
jgi:hypothetical protein